MGIGDPGPARTHARALPERSRLYVSVTEALEEDILSARLRVGDRLPAEAEIARRFNVSTRSVREALQVLETKGLVRRKHGERTHVVRDDIGKFVGSLAVTVRQLFSRDANYMLQLMDVRRMIEVDVVGRLAGAPERVFAEVESALAAFRLAVDAKDVDRVIESDAAFHLALVHATGNEILNVFYENTFGLIIEEIRATIRIPDKSLEAAYQEHREIYRLVQAGNAAGARAAMRRQIDGSAENLRLAIEAAHEDADRAT